MCRNSFIIWALAGFLSGAAVHAVTLEGSDQRYQGIVDRNIFNLHPPPPPLDPSELARKQAPIPKLTLNGITTILGTKNVILTMPASKPGAAPETLMLAEGQAQDDVEVKEIDEKAAVVRVINHGEEEVLDFEDNGTKPSAPAANPAAPFALPPPAPPVTMPSMPIRPIRNNFQRRNSPLSGVDNSNPFGGGSSLGGGNGGDNSYSVSAGASSETAPNAVPLTPEQTTLLIEAQRMKALQEGDPIAKILPPTDMTPEITGEGQTPAPQ